MITKKAIDIKDAHVGDIIEYVVLNFRDEKIIKTGVLLSKPKYISTTTSGLFYADVKFDKEDEPRKQMMISLCGFNIYAKKKKFNKMDYPIYAKSKNINEPRNEKIMEA